MKLAIAVFGAFFFAGSRYPNLYEGPNAIYARPRSSFSTWGSV